MRLRLRLPAAAVLAATLTACGSVAKDESSGPASTDTDPAPPSGPAPCADGTWMGAASPGADWLYLGVGTDPGDGSYTRPFTDVGRAAAALAARGSGTLAVLPGTYTYGRAVRAISGGALVVRGCGAESRFALGGGGQPSIALEGPGAVSLEHVAISGGSPGLALRAGVQATVEDVSVEDTERVGVQVVGSGTAATLRDVTVRTVVGAGRDAASGWGIALTGGELAIEGGSVSEVGGYAVYAERGALSITGTTLRAAAAGGLYAHAMGAVTVDSLVVEDVGGEGIHVYEASDASIVGSQVRRVSPATLRGVGDRSRGAGDGIVVRRGARPTSVVRIEGNTVSDAARLGIAVDGGTVTLSGNVTMGNGAEEGGASTWATAATTVEGAASRLDTAVYPLGREQHPGEGPPDYNRPRRR